MQDNQKKKAAKEFAEQWKGHGYEKGESQKFWLQLLHDVLGVEDPFSVISFENQVKLSHTSFIDAYIPHTKVMIEQKGIDKDLRASVLQSDGSSLTPFQQAKRYASELPVSKHPRWIVTCNFRSFLIYDMEQPQGEPFEILLENLEKEYHQLQFLVSDGDAKLKHEMEVSIAAGDLVGRIYDSFLKPLGDNPTADDLHALNVLCVRLVFCLYAEDAGVFEKDQFFHYLSEYQPQHMRAALRDLFQVLDTPIKERDRFLEPKLAAFPYVNGSLFKQRPGEFIPPLSEETAATLLDKASVSFDWSDISPTIFGAVFESTLNPETRRSGGMHYTSIENIHRVIDPLFLEDLTTELTEIIEQPRGKQRTAQLNAYQEKLASLRFLDPACGSGNFLTETYISLRRLENRVITALNEGQAVLGFDEQMSPIKVDIHQFYGIEINDFAVTVATTALWIAEAQMMNETERIVSFTNDYLPLKTYNNIYEGNALRVDWTEVVDPKELDYIIGNPPFVGFTFMDSFQKEDMSIIYPKIKNLDYVCCWYKKASEFIKRYNIHCAFVSTNSITQGEIVPRFWPELNVKIDFAYKSFRWDSESSQKAQVHCVIVGFSDKDLPRTSLPKLFDGVSFSQVGNISPYLFEGEEILIPSRTKPLCDIPNMTSGNKFADGGFLIINNEEEYESFVKEEPDASKYIKPLIGAAEFINNKKRWCLWLKDASPNELRQCPKVMERIKGCRESRLNSIAPAIRRFADTPTLFAQITQPLNCPCLIIPQVSSQRRRYIPIGYIDGKTICTDKLRIVPNASLYHFGILTSNVHMAWMRAFCMRLKSDYSYSRDIVYNNFPWPTPTEEQKAKIEQTAQAILDARALYPDSSLADLYDEVTMPVELRKAHQNNDRAVMQAYGFPIKDFTESDCVAKLLEMYKTLTEKSRV